VGIVRRKHIRALVEDLLTKNHVRAAPVPVEDIVRSLGVAVRKEPAPDDLSGFLVRDLKRRRAVIGVNKHHPATRQRFTIGHELGHFLLHEGEQVHVDRANVGFQVKLRHRLSGDGTDTEEKEANLFAAELLMPARLLEHDLAHIHGFSLLDEDVINELSKKYKVSCQALTFRLANLGHIEL
jgi:Zn-dependent peptidase ImmA (M78 family)